MLFFIAYLIHLYSLVSLRYQTFLVATINLVLYVSFYLFMIYLLFLLVSEYRVENAEAYVLFYK